MEQKQLEIESESSVEFSLYEFIKRLIDVVCSFLGVLTTIDLNLYISNSLPSFPTLFWERNIGPLEVVLIIIAIIINKGLSINTPRKEKQLEIESKSSIEFSLYEVIKRLIDVVCSFERKILVL